MKEPITVNEHELWLGEIENIEHNLNKKYLSYINQNYVDFCFNILK